MSRIGIGFSSLVGFLLLLPIAWGQIPYITTHETEAFIGVEGRVVVDHSATTGVMLEVQGNPGSRLRVISRIFLEDPHPTAYRPPEISLRKFFEIRIEVIEGRVRRTIIKLSFTEEDIGGLEAQQIQVFKLNPEINAYEPWPTIVDRERLQAQVTLENLKDPVLALGGRAPSPSPLPSQPLEPIILLLVVIVAILGVLFRMRKRSAASLTGDGMAVSLSSHSPARFNYQALYMKGW